MMVVERTVFIPKDDVLSLCFALVLDTDSAALRRWVGGHFTVTTDKDEFQSVS